MTDTLTRPRAAAAPAAPFRLRGRMRLCLPVVVILLVQLGLTIRLIPYGYASTDESRFIEAGHAIIYELLHGGGSPYYETYFSGAPVLYSPLAAMADHVGGLAAVRLMSAAFMQVATFMLFLTARRLFGYWPAVLACALYAGLALTQVVGRNAIYDALALMLMSIAAYFASRTTKSESTAWLLLIPVTLLAADAAKYVTLLFNPAVVLIAAWQIRDQGTWAVLRRVAVLGTTSVALLVVAVFLAGSAYLKGIMFSTLARNAKDNILLGASPTANYVILHEALHWFGLIAIMAFVAVALAAMFPAERGATWLLLTFAITSIVVTLEAIKLGSDESMGRHDAFGAWFGCIAAGYLLATLARKMPWRRGRLVLAAGIAGLIVFCGVTYTFGKDAFADHGAGSDTELLLTVTPTYTILKPYLDTGQRYLLSGEDDYAMMYNDHLWIPWWNLVDDNYIKYPVPGRGGNWHDTTRGRTCTSLLPGCQYLEGPAGYVAAIKAHTFAVISITRLVALPADQLIERTTEATPGYVLLTTTGGGPTWIYLPDYQHKSPSRQA